MPSQEKFDLIKFATGPFNWRNYAKLLVYGTCIMVLFSVYTTIMKYLNPRKDTTKIVTRVEAGGTSNVTNITNVSQDLKQGIYLRGASDRASVGVFKEVFHNIDISAGGGKDYDDDAFGEIEVRLKF